MGKEIKVIIDIYILYNNIIYISIKKRGESWVFLINTSYSNITSKIQAVLLQLKVKF